MAKDSEFKNDDGVELSEEGNTRLNNDCKNNKT
jgi:hypothetical protein